VAVQSGYRDVAGPSPGCTRTTSCGGRRSGLVGTTTLDPSGWTTSGGGVFFPKVVGLFLARSLPYVLLAPSFSKV